VDAAHLKKIEDGAATMGLRLSPEQLKLLGRHVDLLLKWNKTINLTAITDPDEVVEKHVLDSLALAPVLPELEVVLVDSVIKKVAFLKNCLAELRLPKVRAVAMRLEGNPSREELPRVHAAVARAFAAPEPWLTLAEQYVLPNGVAICMLGPGDLVPERVGQMELQRELAYALPYSGAQRRLAVYKHV
jgi:16S rRNA (guanine527-N7)-methyltransferase